mgnify:CR=1 FL=1
MGRYAPIIDRRAGMSQEEINRILRPNKRRFGQAKLSEVVPFSQHFLFRKDKTFKQNNLFPETS